MPAGKPWRKDAYACVARMHMLVGVEGDAGYQGSRARPNT